MRTANRSNQICPWDGRATGRAYGSLRAMCSVITLGHPRRCTTSWTRYSNRSDVFCVAQIKDVAIDRRPSSGFSQHSNPAAGNVGVPAEDRNTHILYLEIITTFPILQSGKKVVIREPSAERAISFYQYHSIRLLPNTAVTIAYSHPPSLLHPGTQSQQVRPTLYLP